MVAEKRSSLSLQKVQNVKGSKCDKRASKLTIK
jgi:hypothetical protein